MKGKLNVASVAGIRVEIHWTFAFILLWAAFIGWRSGGGFEAVLWSVLLFLTIFTCVVLHEFGHALTAKRYGVVTTRITLLPIGGVASLKSIPDNPRQELIIATMGPAVNVLIAVLLYPVIYTQLAALGSQSQAKNLLLTISSQNFLIYLFLSNVVLVIFNLIPAFPMDGGRILRAILSFRMGRVHATQIAARLGQVIALLFLVLGLFYNPFLILIGLFVFFGASGEYTMVKQLDILQGHKMADAMMTHFTVFHPEDSLDLVANVLLSGAECQFLVQGPDNEIVGLLDKKILLDAFHTGKNNLRVADIMERDFTPVKADGDLKDIYRMVQQKKQYFFPVIRDGELAGVIDMENINEFIMIQANHDF
ncbi:MAG: site-2 protease family protein [Saprospiraceae bacterium]|nr:site-2 protease family protein [Saprospiraceae bacterium]